jgi:hypothetical protein
MLSMDERTAMGAVPRPVHGAVLRAVLEFYERFWSSTSGSGVLGFTSEIIK